MKKVIVQSKNRMMTAYAHLLVWRPDADRPWLPKGTLIAAGFLSERESAVGIAASIIQGDDLTVYKEAKSYSVERTLDSQKSFRWIHKGLGHLDHSLVIHKAAMDETLPEGCDTRVILVPEGGESAAVDVFFRRFATIFSLPDIPQWALPVWCEAEKRNHIRRLEVWTDKDVPAWQHAMAYDVRPTLDREEAKDIVSTLLQAGTIALPQGVTDAPRVQDVLAELPPQEDGNTRTIDYLEAYAPHLATAIEELAEPLHDVDRPIEPAIASMKRVPFPAQAHSVQAVVNTLCSGKKAVFVSSDMGTGKSIVALATANAMAARTNGYAVLMLLPAITIPKWITSEIEATLPGAAVTVLESWKDVLRYEAEITRRGKKALEFVLIGRDTAKLGMPKVPALGHKDEHIVSDRSVENAKYRTGHRVRDVWICPDCGDVQVKQTKEAQKARDSMGYVDGLRETALGFNDLAKGWHDDGSVLWRDNTAGWHCTSCGHNLMRHKAPEREKVAGLTHRRIAPADLIARRLNGHFDLLVIDELHQYKNASGQGTAMGQLVGACKQTIGLTGTLSDGKASSLYHILWRVSPGRLLAEGFDHRSMGRFISLYGSVEWKTREKDEVDEQGQFVGKKVIKNPPKEIPGLSPKLFVNHLADKCVFLELGDIGLPLVELEERPVLVTMDASHERAYTAFHANYEDLAKRAFAAGNHAAFARFIPSVVNAANQPHKSNAIPLLDETVYFDAVLEEGERSAKERRILADVQAELSQDRRCVLYVRYTGDWRQDTRLADVLKAENIKVRTLHASVAPEDRIDWLADAVKQGVEVVVCNAKLVEVGLDLYDFPTLMFYQFTDEVATMRQAARRAWRIGQHRMCKILYYVYEQSYEVVQLRRMLHKRAHALLLEGRLDRSEVATFAPQDELSASAMNIAACLGDLDDLSAKWQTLADKDVPQGVTMLSEEAYRQEIKKAMARLADETRRMAGIPANMPMIECPLVLAAPEEDRQSDLGGLFAAEVPTDPSVDATVLVKTVGELRASMGLAKKARRVKDAGDNQLAFAF